MNKHVWLCTLIAFVPTVQAEVHTTPASCGWPGAHIINVEDGWIDVAHGGDEDRQHLRLAIWGSERVEVRCEQLDNDGEDEIVIISRGIGSGPYYSLQIIDLRVGGISTWAASSQGKPTIEDTNILLGTLPSGYQGAASMPEFARFRLTNHGIVPAEGESRLKGQPH